MRPDWPGGERANRLSRGGTVREDTLIVVDPTDMRKPHVDKMPYLSTIRNGSKGELGIVLSDPDKLDRRNENLACFKSPVARVRPGNRWNDNEVQNRCFYHRV